MNDARRNYASDETVKRINAAGRRLSAAQYVYLYDEAEEPFFAVIRETNWIMDAIPILLEIRGTLTFAVAGGSTSPFQVSNVGNDEFVVLIDERAFYLLLTLSLRIQSLPPLAELLETEEKAEKRDYSGKFLLDITKDITFQTTDVSFLLTGKVHMSVYRAAVTYIIGHEIAHVSHGHLEFLNSAGFIALSLNEIDRNLTLRTLEMDADSSATSSVFDVFENVIRLRSQERTVSNGADAILLRKQYVAGAFIALIYLDTLASNYLPKSHPIGYARFLTTFGVFCRIFETHCPEATNIPEQVRATIVDAFVRLSGSLENLGYPMASNVAMHEGDKPPVAMYDDIGIAAGLDHIAPLHGRWSRLRPFLEAFHRGGRLAPATSPPI